MSITTSLPELAVPTTPAIPTPAPGEPAILRRERAVFREILRLVAERAAAEAQVEGARSRGDATADSEYERTKRTLREKVQQLDRDARAADEQKRRSIVEAAMRGEAEAKQQFADASRRIASEFDKHRETARNELGRGRSDAAASFDAGQLKAAKEHSEAIAPILELVELADSHRERLAALAADHTKLRLDPEPPSPSDEDLRSSRTRSTSCSIGCRGWRRPLKLLEGLVIPKLMIGAREAWIHVVVIGAVLGIAAMAGGGAAGIGGGLAAGAALAVLLRIWLVKLSKDQLERLYLPLMKALADADNLAAYCRAGSTAGSTRRGRP